MAGALTAALDGAESYSSAIAKAKDITKGMIDEATLAGTITAQLAGGLAANAEEAARLTRAGGILSTVFSASGASLEGFNRLLSTGSAALLDNFNLTQGMVAERQNLIEATTTLHGQEAKLLAIKQLLIESSEKFEGSISAEQEAMARATAAWADFTGAMGEFLAGPGADILEWGASSARALEEGAKAWQGAGDQIETIGELRGLEAQRAQLVELNKELTTLRGIVDFLGDESPADVIASDMEQIARVESEIAAIEDSLELARRATIRLDGALVESGLPEYQQAAFNAALAVDALAAAQERVSGAAGARLTGLAARFGAAPTETGTAKRQLIDLETTKQARIDAEEEIANAAIAVQSDAASFAANAWNSDFESKKGVIASVLGEGFGVLSDLDLPFLSDSGGRDIAENARRLASIAMGDFTGQASQLLEQEKPELFAKLMASGDPAAMAKDILTKFQSGADDFGLIDEATALERARKIIFGNMRKEDMAARLTQELMGEGFSQEQISGALGEAGFAEGGNEKAVEGGAVGFQDFETGMLQAAEEAETMGKLGQIFAAQLDDNPEWINAGMAAGQAFEDSFFASFKEGGWGGRMISFMITEIVSQIGLPHPMEARGIP